MNNADWLLQKAVVSNVPVLLLGDPGCGKSARVEAIASAAGFSFFPIVLSQYDPVEVHGLLTVDSKAGLTRRSIPDWVSPAIFEDGFKAVLFFDEITTASPSQQAAVLRLLSNRQLGGRTLGNEVRLIAAGNPTELACGGYDLSAPSANRFAHVRMETDVDDFLQNFVDLWAGWRSSLELPPAPTEDELRRARTLIVGFLSRRRDLVAAVPTDPESQSGAWASKRTWELCSRLMAGESSHERILAAAAATVGTAIAAELCAYLREADIPDPEDILRDPEAVPVPERGDVLFAALSATVAAALGRPDKDRVKAVWTYFRRVAEAGHTDVCGPFLRRMVTEGGKFFSPLSDPSLIAPFRRVMEAAGR